jgi:transcriptional regulator with XRE-family HTH domain
MTNLDSEICRKIREARRAAGLSQTALSSEVGCKQSALCMFERGDGTKLNDETVEKLCAKFKIEIPRTVARKGAEASASVRAAPPFGSAAPRTGFCPNPDCPSHSRYEVDGRVLFQPSRERQDPAGGKFCAVCGEVLERKCPNCGAPVHDGAICTFCGNPYVA